MNGVDKGNMLVLAVTYNNEVMDTAWLEFCSPMCTNVLINNCPTYDDTEVALHIKCLGQFDM